jgi:threonylcarbamoyladenosine tRNA methylthiotransferase MtaB
VSSLEPSPVIEEVVALMAEDPRLARHLHIPLQSGSDAVLARMGRGYTAAEFAALLARVHAASPECGIGTDVICGFPGETDEDHRRTVALLEELPVTYLHPFTYSERPGVPAATYGEPVPGDVRKERTRELKRLSRAKSRAFRERHVGRTLPVLVEEVSRDGAPFRTGLTDNYLRVELGPGRARRPLETVRLTGLTDDGLVGESVGAA